MSPCSILQHSLALTLLLSSHFQISLHYSPTFQEKPCISLHQQEHVPLNHSSDWGAARAGYRPQMSGSLQCEGSGHTGSSRLSKVWPCSERNSAVLAPAARSTVGIPPARNGRASRVGATECPSSLPTWFVQDVPAFTCGCYIHMD